MNDVRRKSRKLKRLSGRNSGLVEYNWFQKLKRETPTDASLRVHDKHLLRMRKTRLPYYGINYDVSILRKQKFSTTLLFSFFYSQKMNAVRLQTYNLQKNKKKCRSKLWISIFRHLEMYTI